MKIGITNLKNRRQIGKNRIITQKVGINMLYFNIFESYSAFKLVLWLKFLMKISGINKTLHVLIFY